MNSRTDGRRLTFTLAVVLLLSVTGPAPAAGGARAYLKKADDWFATDEAKRIAANILSYQADEGGWPKNLDTTAAPFTGDRKTLKGTFDNGATTDELRFLARAYSATKDKRYLEAYQKGLAHILKAQYPTGGWPQSTPPGKGYHRHITFNDDAMVRLLEFLREVGGEKYAFVEAKQRQSAREAFDRGVQCILECQIKVKGKLTAWCAQHDEVDLRPRPGRSYELVSLSGAESVGVVRLLMSLDAPSPEVVQAVEGAVAWFGEAKLTGIRVVVQKDDKAPTGKDRVVVKDPAAPPLWARFYEIGTNRPIFADRDGVARHELSQIGHERRNGYAWLGTWPQRLLEQDSPGWKKRLAAAKAVKVRIVLVGDSTVAEGSGWGPGFAKLLGPGAECVNLARSGRSSKSYINEGHWKKALAQKPDYVLIQFGHNDMPGKGPERETDPKTTYREYMTRYVEEARAAGARPVLVTSMTRRIFTKEGTIRSDLAAYVEAVKQLAADRKVPLVDLHRRSIELLDCLGPEAAVELDPPSKTGKPDHTHLSARGGAMMAKLVAEELRKAEPGLAKFLE